MGDAPYRRSSSDRPTPPGPDEIETLAGSVATVVRRDAGPPAVGASVSRYVVLEQVGQGGMARVLRAYDPKLQREVALKRIRREALGDDATRRLVAEARAMAKLSHPNVVAVYDVEALESGELVLVMEYVEGQTLGRWLSERTRDWHVVVKQFRAAGRGLMAAHEAGVFHRDFKPTNVLVSVGGTVKVTDFGLAKPTHGGAPPPSLSGEAETTEDDLTEAGTVMGTRRYMAPEQHRGATLTPNADQYAFCVALWEALCGTPPFSGRGLLENKENGPTAWSAANVPRPIGAAIVRGLAPHPRDRWPSMGALLEALAWDPTTRRRRQLAAVGGAGVLAVAGLTWHSWVTTRAARCTGAAQQLVGIWDDERREEVKRTMLGLGKSHAIDVWERTQRDLDEYVRVWTAMHLESCEATTIRGTQSAAMMDLRMACLRRAAVDLRAVTEQLANADTEVLRNAHRLTGGLPPVTRCGDLEALREAVQPPLPEEVEEVEALRALVAEAMTAREAGHFAQAKAAVESAKALLAGVEYGPVHTEVALAEGRVLDELGDYDAAEAALRRALESAAHWRQWDELVNTATTLLYVVGTEQKRIEEGLRYVELARGLAAGDPRREAFVANNLAAVLDAQGKHAESEAEHRRALAIREKALGPEHLETATSRGNLAIALHAQSDYAGAEVEHRRALAIREKALGPQHPDVAGSRNNLAATLLAQGKAEAAEAELRRALALREKALDPEHPDVAQSRNNLAAILQSQGKHAEAEAEHRRALAIWEKMLGPEHPEVATSRNNLALVLHARGKYAAAETEHRRALAIWETALGPEHPDVALSRSNLALTLHAEGKHEEAEEGYRRALAVRENALGPDHPEVAMLRTQLARLLFDRGRSDEALEVAEQAWARQDREDAPPGDRAESAFVLARVRWAGARTSDDRARARALAERALADYGKAMAAGQASPEDGRKVQRWLDVHRDD